MRHSSGESPEGLGKVVGPLLAERLSDRGVHHVMAARKSVHCARLYPIQALLVSEQQQVRGTFNGHLCSQRPLAHGFEPCQGVRVRASDETRAIPSMSSSVEVQHMAHDVVVKVRYSHPAPRLFHHAVLKYGREDDRPHREDARVGVDLAPADSEDDVAALSTAERRPRSCDNWRCGRSYRAVTSHQRWLPGPRQRSLSERL
ncbi:hypothetical protein HPB48_000800 [Haemaphysalis longicornis]|uniref:Uncharacterized protein n=1 Tax=Haemaphysalis longicornis TaxID=44386 RepID=A0A9J6GHZ1_HAELO|nr:hypothetical protein HPB48_000800 [Haemaphysalis longicornis]